MSWASVQEAVRQAVAAATGRVDRLGADGATTIHDVEWENRREASLQWGDSATVDLCLGPVSHKGTGETRFEYDADEDTNIPTVNIYALFTVTVKIRSLSQAGDEEAVGALASALRLKLRKIQRIRDILTAANVSVVDIGETANVDELEINGRMMSVSITDLRLATTESFTDTDDAGDYIAHAEGTGELWGVDEEDVRVEADFDTDRVG